MLQVKMAETEAMHNPGAVLARNVLASVMLLQRFCTVWKRTDPSACWISKAVDMIAGGPTANCGKANTQYRKMCLLKR